MRKRTIRERGLPGTAELSPQPYEKLHAKLSRRAAAEGFVLLKNEGGLLPLREGSAVALYGAGALKTVKGGTGSGDVNERYSVSVYEGLKNAGFTITSEKWIEAYEAEYRKARQTWKAAVLEKYQNCYAGVDFFAAYSTTPFYLPTGSPVSKTESDTAIYVLSRVAGENADREMFGGDYLLSNEERAMLQQICSLYPKLILLVNTGGVVDLSFLDELPQIGAVLLISQPGMEGGNAVADVLSGKLTPSGKLTDTWARRYEDYPTAIQLPRRTAVPDKAWYEEDIYVGYRYFDSFQVPARYGFGFGLSYTTFSLRIGEILSSPDGGVALAVTVTNTGALYSGREVVQVYASLPAGRLEKEARRLVAFAKTGILAPGQAETLRLAFSAEELSSFDEAAGAWVLEAGMYGLFVGASLAESKLYAVLSLREEKCLRVAGHICPLKEELVRLHRAVSQDTLKEQLMLSDSLQVIPYDLSGIETTVVPAQTQPGEDEASELVATLSTEQLIALATGDPIKGQGSALGSAGVSVPGSAGETSTCALEQGIANIVLADGPAGLRLNQRYYVREGKAQMLPFEASLEHGLFYNEPEAPGEPRYQFCTAIPVGTLLAQSWDTALVEEVGAMIGEEMERFGVTLWLAPGMNIHRDPLCGRNFEYYSEDPLLSGKIAAAMTRGVQSHPGCDTTIKHFCCNNQEDNRTGRDSVVSERTLREIYLRGFGIAIRESQPMSMMTSYNLVNGVHTANSYDLCTRAARQEFGFEGFIMTDWTTTELGPDCTAAGCMLAGNDLVMPGQFSDQESIRFALERGELSADTLRDCITRLVRVILRSNCYQ